MSRQTGCDESDRTNSVSTTLRFWVAIFFAIGIAISHWVGRDSQASGRSRQNNAAQQQPATSQPAAQPADRFDNKVRESFFAGFAGDEAALDRGMKICDEALAKNPRDGVALVWHGSGLVFRGGQLFRKGDFAQGRGLWRSGLKEMDDAAALQPGDLQVLIPRGATLLSASRFASQPDEAKDLLKKGVDNFEAALKFEEPYFGELSLHSRGELLFGLADGWYRLGDAKKATSYFNRILTDAAGSGRDKQAAQFLKTGELPKNLTCVGCHK